MVLRRRVPALISMSGAFVFKNTFEAVENMQAGLHAMLKKLSNKL